MSSRYSSFTDSRSSAQSDPSSSTELKPKTHSNSSFKRLIGGSKSRSHQKPPEATAIVPQSSSRALAKTKNEQSFTTMVKKFMEKKPKAATRGGLIVAADFLAEDLKRNGKKGSNFSGLHKKLFSSGKGERQSDGKALTEVKANSRTLGMVLRSERELLSQNKDLEMEITDLKLSIEEKNKEVEKLKDLCLKQREEIKALKSAILFPDVMNSQLQDLLEKQGSELKQAKELIPSLQRQVTSLTGQLQFLAEDLIEVKADKFSVRGCYDDPSSPRTPMHDQEEAANSLEFSSRDHTSPGSPDDLFLKDLNPCLTPYYATKSKEFEAKGYNSPHDDSLSPLSMRTCDDLDFDVRGRKLSKSSDYCKCSNSRNNASQGVQRSNESKFTHGQHRHHKLF